MLKTKINNIEELKKLAGVDEGLECYIMLNGGIRSSKHIYYADGIFEVFNEVDSTRQNLTEAELMNRNYSNVGEAIVLGALFIY